MWGILGSGKYGLAHCTTSPPSFDRLHHLIRRPLGRGQRVRAIMNRLDLLIRSKNNNRREGLLGCTATEIAVEMGLVMKSEARPMPSEKNRILNAAARETVRAFLLSLGLTVLLAVGFNQTLHLDQSLIREKNHSVVTDKALAVAAQIESELNSDVYLANGLAALVVAAPGRQPIALIHSPIFRWFACRYKPGSFSRIG